MYPIDHERTVMYPIDHERTVTWADDQKKYMLDWYMDYLKNEHVGFKFKKQHHLSCADALNKKFAIGVNVDQVVCQYMHYKENWKIIAAALSKSGNSFHHTRCIVTILESEKATLCVCCLNHIQVLMREGRLKSVNSTSWLQAHFVYVCYSHND
jgi:hypothetical protein